MLHGKRVGGILALNTACSCSLSTCTAEILQFWHRIFLRTMIINDMIILGLISLSMIVPMVSVINLCGLVCRVVDLVCE